MRFHNKYVFNLSLLGRNIGWGLMTNPSSTCHVVSTTIDQELVIVWRKLPRGWFKCNVNASFSFLENKFDVGMCLRDENCGIFIVVRTFIFQPLCDVHLEEAMRLLLTINLMQELGITYVIIELDANIVVDAFTSSSTPNFEFFVLFNHVKIPFLFSLVTRSLEGMLTN